jgi:uncharacterized protein (TIGR02246 family)
MDHEAQQQGGASDEREVRDLYRHLLEAWNRRDVRGFAELFAVDAVVVGFDGSLMAGAGEIARELGSIFADHVTAAYVGIVREVRFLAAEVALLRAVAGMVPPGQRDINPATNAIQSLLVQKFPGGWRIVHYQNTPAQFHGRPALVEQMTEELRRALAG